MIDEARLEVILASIGDLLVVDEDRPIRWRSRVLAAAAVVLVAGAATVLIVAPARDAVADWLGIGSTSIEQVGDAEADTAGLPGLVDTLQPLPVTGLGEPQRIAVVPEGGVVLVWADGATTLWIRNSGEPRDVAFQKLLADEQSVEQVEGIGDTALFVGGEHILVSPFRRVAANSVLLWIDGSFEYRLESNLDKDEMIEIAASASSPQPTLEGEGDTSVPVTLKTALSRGA